MISKSFREDLKKIKEKIEKLKSRWFYVDTVSIDNPKLYQWMDWDLDSLPQDIRLALKVNPNITPPKKLVIM